MRLTFSRAVWTVTIIVSVLYYGRYGREAYNFYGDALGYYMYLPATFIYHNHQSIERLPQDRGIRPFIHSYAAQMGGGQRTPKGYVLNQYTYGVALMESPAFFAAHAWEKIRGRAANGFSDAYRTAIGLITILYGLLGLWITYRVLRHRFTKQVSSVTTALVLLATNLFWFVLHQQGMAHVPLFCLIALLMLLTIRVYEHGQWYHFAALGLTAGLITVIRPVDGLCVLIPVLYSAGRPCIPAKLRFIRAHWTGILIAGICAVMPIIPQLTYWKWLTGYTVYDSYGPSQGFDFLHSHVIKGLFGASNGWLFYTPLMILALIGSFFIRRLGQFAPAVPVLLAAYIWCIYAWFVPNYPNGLGSRPMVDLYAVLAFPLAAVIERIGGAKRSAQIAVSGVVVICIAINLSCSVQQATGIIWSEDSKYAYNLQTAFRYSLRYDDLVVWDLGVRQPDPGRLHLTAPAWQVNLADSTYADHVPTNDTDHMYKVAAGEEYPPLVLRIPAATIAGGARWLKGVIGVVSPEPEYSIYNNAMLVIQAKRHTETLFWHGLRLNNKVGLLEPGSTFAPELFTFREGIPGRVSCFVPIPGDLKPDDTLRLEVWNLSKKPLHISELRAEAYR